MNIFICFFIPYDNITLSEEEKNHFYMGNYCSQSQHFARSYNLARRAKMLAKRAKMLAKRAKMLAMRAKMLATFVFQNFLKCRDEINEGPGEGGVAYHLPASRDNEVDTSVSQYGKF